jgi:integrating conjugative element protein (TIGR03758 family)
MFEAGAGVSAGSVKLFIALLTAVSLLLWAVWVIQGLGRLWVQRGLSLNDMVWGVVRALIVIMLLGFYIR